MSKIIFTTMFIICAMSLTANYLFAQGYTVKAPEHEYSRADRDGMDRLIAKNSAADVFPSELPERR